VNRSQLVDDGEVSGRVQPTPLGKSGGAVSLKVVSAVEVAFLIEVVVDGGVDGSEFLQASHLPEAQHRTFSSSKWQVGILRPIVQPARLCHVKHFCTLKESTKTNKIS